MTQIADQDMSPDASPGHISKTSGVRTLNNKPIFIVVGIVLAFALILGMVAMDRANKANKVAGPKEDTAASSSMLAKEIAGNFPDGIVPAKAPEPLVVPDLNAPPKPGLPSPSAIAIAMPSGNLDTPPLPPMSAPLPPNSAQPQLQAPRNDLDNRIRMAKLQQFEEAVKAKTSINVTAARSAGGSGHSGAPMTREEHVARLATVRQQIEASTQDDPTAAYKARLAQLQGSGAIPSSSSDAPQMMPAQASSGNNIAQFGKSGRGDRWKLDSQTEAPRSPYELRAGFVVPATLISGINSELPGQIMGQVSQNVFDTATGKYLLIPQGSRLVGQYSSNVAYGQARVLVAWQRIIFPDGKAIDLGSMAGADSAGYAGLNDQVNNHYVRLFASAILMSGVSAGISLSQPKQTGPGIGVQTAGSAMSEALGQQLGQVTAQLIAKNMNTAPTLEIRPGYRFNVMVTKDLTFSKPYQSFDY